MTSVYPPIILPHPTDPAWDRAKEIVTALRARGEQNPFVVAALGNGYAESHWTAVIAGDRGNSFGPWQQNWRFYGAPCLAATGIDIRTEPSLARHVDALLWSLSQHANAVTLAALDAAQTGADGIRIFASGFERASAAGFVERRVALAGPLEVWLEHAT